MEARRRDQGDEPRDEIERIQQHGVRPIAPGVLEPVHQTLAIGRELEPLLSDWRSRDVPAQPLESTTISTVDRRACVHVDPTDFGERLAGCRYLADRMHKLACALPGRSTEQLAITDGRAVARGECRLVVRELVSVGIVVELVERATMTLAHAGERATSATCSVVGVGRA